MTSTFLPSVELTTPGTFTHTHRLFRAFVFLLGFIAAMIAVEPASAQTPVPPGSCFPTCSDVDSRFISIAGTNLSTLSNSEVIMKIASPGVATAVEIGIFDGETGGMWDFGTTPLTFTLYSDPTGAGTGTTQVASWAATDMVDNAWKTFTVANPVSARAPNGNYLYRLVIRTTDALASYMSNFKVRTNGTVALRAQAFTVAAAGINVADLDVIYPEGWSNVTPSTPTTYDGSFDFYLDIQTKGSVLSVWDGDMDFGSFDCSIRDADDINTPNNILPPWATSATANLEGVGFGDPCGIGTGLSTGTPPDDFRSAVFRRVPAVTYQVISPQGKSYNNANPSGSKEWEEFRIATGPVNTLLNDAKADSLPAGIYNVKVNGMDLGNLNGWRFFFDALGVDGGGDPTPPLLPYSISGIVCFAASTDSDDDDDDDDHGKCYYNDDDDDGRGNRYNDRCTYSGRRDDDDDDGHSSSRCTKSSHRHNGDDDDDGGSRYSSRSNDNDDNRDRDDDDDDDYRRNRDGDHSSSRCTKSSHHHSDPATTPASKCGTAIQNVKVVLVGDLNGDGVNDIVRETTTNSDGRYSFPELNVGSYRVFVITSTLPSGSTPTADFDGVATPNVAAVVIATGAPNPDDVFFRYKLGSTSTGTGGVRSYGYWKTHSEKWPSTSIMMGCTTYTRSRAIEIMKKSVSGDKTYSMYKQLAAAKLNVAAGAKSSCILSTITAAESWLCSNKLGSNVSSSSYAWRNSGGALHDALEAYNTGRSCAPYVN